MLLDYLKKNYKINEPIFVKDIDLPVSNTNLRQMFKNLYDNGQIERFDSGIYYLKSKGKQSETEELTADVVAKYKYMSNKFDVYGYISGYTFANKLGLTAVFPLTVEITTNNTASKYREVYIHNLKVALRKPRIRITKDNVYILQLLDLLKDADLYIDDDIRNADEIIAYFIRRHKIRRNDLDRYLYLYPEKVYRFIYELRLYEAFLD